MCDRQNPIGDSCNGKMGMPIQERSLGCWIYGGARGPSIHCGVFNCLLLCLATHAHTVTTRQQGHVPFLHIYIYIYMAIFGHVNKI